MNTDELTDIEITMQKWKIAFWLFKLKQLNVTEQNFKTIEDLKKIYEAKCNDNEKKKKTNNEYTILEENIDNFFKSIDYHDELLSFIEPTDTFKELLDVINKFKKDLKEPENKHDLEF